MLPVHVGKGVAGGVGLHWVQVCYASSSRVCCCCQGSGSTADLGSVEQLEGQCMSAGVCYDPAKKGA